MECTCIHLGLEMGPVVQGFIRVDGKAELMRFVARNIRAITPLRWDLNSGQGVLTRFDTGVDHGTPQVVNDRGSVPADLSELPPEELRKLKSQSMPASSQPRLVAPEPSIARKKPGELQLTAAAPLPQSARTSSSFLEPARTSITASPTSPADTADLVNGSPEGSAPSSSEAPRFVPTRRCPACESGKVVGFGTTRNIGSVLLNLKNVGKKDVWKLRMFARQLNSFTSCRSFSVYCKEETEMFLWLQRQPKKPSTPFLTLRTVLSFLINESWLNVQSMSCCKDFL